MLKRIMITILAVAILSVTVSANVQAATITVQKGDTLWDLSRENNTSLENIQKWNRLTTDLIHPGDILTISPKKQYTVKQGDTLWDISMDNQITVSQLKEWNELHTDLIHPGLNLLIFDSLNTVNNTVTEKQPIPAAQAHKENAPAVSATSTSNTSSKESVPAVPAASTNNTSSKEITVKATAYTASCEGCSGTTATGIDLKANPNAKVIAVDPSVIPLGSKVHVEGYGEAVAGDTGGAIKGNRIDIFIPSEHDAINFGVKQVKVTILN
ncbi:peptidoglycan-binding protein [Bacillus sp. AFS076308]|uniref:3D domain-containing protein n=1 Tax=unclassified Bacillus (in: firmicutes) TaxID=185979 RepID=UPI000BF754AB|nr:MULTISPECIES: 3D domain-containing protein [unclassified Bacillus (in: firmicutes)]PFN79161.1 peptidoglycan-binding protein [Bacillus sp. AFS076308]PGV49608.1 peptidoglycan-binding protein [Bacillus sp. AFS037270]